MPITPEDLASINASLQSFANVYAASDIGKKTRKWNEAMYDKQRQHALEDWERQNAYNHPSAQMARMREAGINPNMIYSKGADAQGGVIRATSTDAWNPTPPRFEGSSMMAYQDTQVKQAQIDNLRAQNTVLANEAVLKQAQAVATAMMTDKTKVDTAAAQLDLDWAPIMKSLQKNLSQADIWKRTAETESIQTGTQISLNQDERAAAQNASSLREAAERILTMRLQRAKTKEEIHSLTQQFQLLKGDAMLKQFDIDLRRRGIDPGSPSWFRSLELLLNPKR